MLHFLWRIGITYRLAREPVAKLSSVGDRAKAIGVVEFYEEQKGQPRYP